MTVLNAVVRPSRMSRTFENAKSTPLLEVQKRPPVGSRFVVPTILIVSGKRASRKLAHCPSGYVIDIKIA